MGSTLALVRQRQRIRFNLTNESYVNSIAANPQQMMLHQRRTSRYITTAMVEQALLTTSSARCSTGQRTTTAHRLMLTMQPSEGSL